jgi:hypothetical protein
MEHGCAHRVAVQRAVAARAGGELLHFFLLIHASPDIPCTPDGAWLERI